MFFVVFAFGGMTFCKQRRQSRKGENTNTPTCRRSGEGQRKGKDSRDVYEARNATDRFGAPQFNTTGKIRKIFVCSRQPVLLCNKFNFVSQRLFYSQIRPLFPRGYNYDIAVTSSVVSADGNRDVDALVSLVDSLE